MSCLFQLWWCFMKWNFRHFHGCVFSLRVFFSLFPRPNHVAVSSVISCSCVKSSFFSGKNWTFSKNRLALKQRSAAATLVYYYIRTIPRIVYAKFMLLGYFLNHLLFSFSGFWFKAPLNSICCIAAIPPALLHEQLQFSPNYPRPFKLETLFDRGKNCSYTLWLNCINKLKVILISTAKKITLMLPNFYVAYGTIL